MRLVQSIHAEADGDDPIRVAIVDDSVVVRGLFSRWLLETPGLAVVGTYRSGRDIINHIVDAAPDVVVLDIEMPEMNGLEALPHILKARPQTVVIVASTLTARNAEISLKCIALGADRLSAQAAIEPRSLDLCRFPPRAHRQDQNAGRPVAFPGLVGPARSRWGKSSGGRRAWTGPRPQPHRHPTPCHPTPCPPRPSPPLPHRMRSVSSTMPRALLIGASTGGPQAVMALLMGLKPVLERLPVLVAQHMPAAFTTMFAEHLTRHAGVDVVQASDGEPVRPGRIYVAPGGRHMEMRQTGNETNVSISDAAPVNFCKPSVDVLFDSAHEIVRGALPRAGSDRHGRRRRKRGASPCRGRRDRFRAGRSEQRRLGHAGGDGEARCLRCRHADPADGCRRLQAGAG